MKGKGIKFRDWLAVEAQFKNSAGTMKVKRQQEERQSCRDFRKNWRAALDEELDLEETVRSKKEAPDDTEESDEQ